MEREKEVGKEERKVCLVSSDGQEYCVPMEVAFVSKLVKEMLEEEEDEKVPRAPLPRVPGLILSIVLEFCEHHLVEPMPELPKPLRSDTLDTVPKWYHEFLERFDQVVFFELVLASNYMDVKPLLDLACAKMAMKIKGKSAEEVRKTFILEESSPMAGSVV